MIQMKLAQSTRHDRGCRRTAWGHDVVPFADKGVASLGIEMWMDVQKICWKRSFALNGFDP